MRVRHFALLLCLWCGSLLAQTTLPARPFPRIERVLVVSIDGLRPDVLLRANGPAIRSLYENGAFTFWARTTPVAITLPSHVSMLTGVAPELHGIDHNGDLEPEKQVYPKVPTLLQLAKRAGYTTAICTGKSKFAVLDAPGVVDYKYLPSETKTTDEDVADHAVVMIREHKPQVMFLHLGRVDHVGHQIGWGTDEQVETARDADKALGRVIDAMREAKVLDATLIIVSADHGGQGKSHGEGDVRSRTIPWIASGPGIRKGYDLSRMGKGKDINTYDTFATACAVLGLPIEGKIDGLVVKDIFENRELLQSR